LASNKIIQSDNAVIDYTVISAIIDAINSQQDIIDNLKTQQDTTVNNYDELGKLVSSRVGPSKTIGSFKAVDSSGNVKITFPSNYFNKVNSVVGIVFSPKKIPATVYLTSFDNNSANFSVVAKSYTGMQVHWIATGISS